MMEPKEPAIPPTFDSALPLDLTEPALQESRTVTVLSSPPIPPAAARP